MLETIRYDRQEIKDRFGLFFIDGFCNDVCLIKRSVKTFIGILQFFLDGCIHFFNDALKCFIIGFGREGDIAFSWDGVVFHAAVDVGQTDVMIRIDEFFHNAGSDQDGVAPFQMNDTGRVAAF